MSSFTLSVYAHHDTQTRAVAYDLTRTTGLPSARHLYLFNGDLVDRGANSVEVLLLVYALKLQYPNSVFVNRCVPIY